MNTVTEVEPRWFARTIAPIVGVSRQAVDIDVSKTANISRFSEPSPIDADPDTGEVIEAEIVKCDNCHRKYRGEDDWLVRFYAGYPMVVLCSDHAPLGSSSDPIARRTFLRAPIRSARYLSVHA
jgi:hypothetical protein